MQQNNTSTTPLAARLLPAMLRRSAKLGPHHSPSPRGNYLDNIQCDHPRAACTVQLSGCIYIGILRHEGKLQMSPISLLRSSHHALCCGQISSCCLSYLVGFPACVLVQASASPVSMLFIYHQIRGPTLPSSHIMPDVCWASIVQVSRDRISYHSLGLHQELGCT